MDDLSGHRFVLHGFVWLADPMLTGVKIPDKSSPKKRTKPLILLGDPGRIRTCDPQLRRLVLYPAELRGLDCLSFTRVAHALKAAPRERPRACQH